MVQNKNNRAVAIWLLLGAGMIIIQVLLGGLTRLTDSGLSITEWKPLLGTIPPMNEQQWQEAFDKYKGIAQYQSVHSHFTLDDFKVIFLWEWFHRLWARLLGVVFLIPFIYFLYKKWINRTMLLPMIILFLLGGLQGFIGWFMVSSGVGTQLIFVDHIRLAVHFIAALILLVYVIWFALRLLIPDQISTQHQNTRKNNFWLLGILTLQLIYGAFMAGSRAGYAATTWPTINGEFFPSTMFGTQGVVHDLFHGLIAIQFIHRILAYVLWVWIVIFTLQLKSIDGGVFFQKVRYLPIIITTTQVILGITTVINYASEYRIILSISHQFIGMLLLVSLVLTLFSLRKSKEQTR